MAGVRILEIGFWVAAALIVYVYLGYPLLLALLNLFKRSVRTPLGYTPSVSVLIAAYNEEEAIGKKIAQTLALDYPPEKLEILVLSDCSTDRTDAMVQGCGDPRVRLVRMPQRRGKTHAQNEGVKQARGEVLVFSDATTVYHPKALQYLACNYQDPAIGAASGCFQYFDSQGNSPTGMGTIMFWNYETVIKRLQSRLRTITGCCGCIYSVRRAAYTDLADDVISDLVQPLQVIRKGYRVRFEDRALAYEETTRSTAEEFSMRVRVVTRAMRGLLSVPDLLQPWKFAWTSFQLISHKVLRWMIPMFLLIMLAASAALAAQPGWYRVLFLLQAGFYLAALLTALIPLPRRFKPLGVLLYFCTLNAAALFSVVEVLRGRKYVVWQTVRNQS